MAGDFVKVIDLTTLKIGSLYTRYDLFEQSVQPGIFTPKGTNAIFLFSDPEAMERYGYIFDGWEGATQTMHYTGAGQNGDQEFKFGNLAILNSLADNKQIYFFLAKSGHYDGRRQKYEYLGQFSLDQDHPYRQEDVVEAETGLKKSMIVFHLKPYDPAIVAERANALTIHTASVSQDYQTTMVQLENNLGSDYIIPAKEETKATKVEKKLEDMLVQYLKAQGVCQPGRLKIAIKGRVSCLYTDVWDADNRHLYEIKSSASREMIRSAIGQLLDYKFQMRQSLNTPENELGVVKCTIVVPHKPTDDLIQLIQSPELQFGLMYLDNGSFVCL